MKKTPANKLQWVATIGAILLGLNLSTPSLFAKEANVGEKIQLMSEALRARDAGDLLLAKEKAESLITLAPNDSNVQNLLLSINEQIEEADLTVPNNSNPDGSKTKDSETEVEESSKSTESTESDNSSILLQKRGIVKFNKSDLLPVEEVSPEFVEQSKIINNLITVLRSQMAAGDYGSAANTLNEIEARDPNSAEAKALSLELSNILAKIQSANLYKTRADMLNSVDNSWERPKVFELESEVKATETVIPSLVRKLESIVLPRVNFTGMELTRVVDTLSELSVEYDSEGEGVNIVVLFNPTELDPKVNITLRNLSLDRILQFVTQQVNFTYDVGDDAVTIQPSDSIGGSSSTITEFFPISRATVIRLTGFRDVSSASAVADPFADPGSGSSGPSQDEETQALQKFFQNAGVNFEGINGSSLAFDGEQLIVTQTPRNIERLRTILRNYSEVKQVEIETKFLEVAQNDLDELGFHWGVTTENGKVINSNLRPLYELGTSSNATNRARIGDKTTNVVIDPTTGQQVTQNTISEYFDNDPVNIDAPKISQSLSYGTGDNFFTDIFNSASGDVFDLKVNALARKTGSDLMSAPKVTVLSGKRANIVVAQELRYPESYGDIESTVSSGGDAAGNAAVSITAGTPQDFITRNVGVEMSVTPNVESDDTISLILEPRVTEFEGFVEYGGPSIALSGDTTAVIPAGFYQPIFSTRSVATEVTIFDGSTVVMGGLTRDEVRSVDDRVPFLGDIPAIGRLFRSEGETRQKRNLLIFVTANLVSPGGSLSNQSYNNIKANTLYQMPAVNTPGGDKYRNVTLTE